MIGIVKSFHKVTQRINYFLKLFFSWNRTSMITSMSFLLSKSIQWRSMRITKAFYWKEIVLLSQIYERLLNQQNWLLKKYSRGFLISSNRIILFFFHLWQREDIFFTLTIIIVSSIFYHYCFAVTNKLEQDWACSKCFVARLFQLFFE